MKTTSHSTPARRRCVGATLAAALGFLPSPASAWITPTHGLTEVTHEQVAMEGGFWGPRLKTQHQVTIPHALDELDKDGHITNFDKAAGTFDGELRGHHAFDSDLYKALEGALLSLQHFEDPALRKRVDDILDRILAAQQEDGYLVTYFIVKEPDQKWRNLRLRHELYNAGHYFEMAVAHHQLTGETKVLDSARRFADHIDRTFGPDKRYDVPGHEEIELALVKLYRETGEKRYLQLSRFFLDERGHAHGSERKPFDPATVVPPVVPPGKLDDEQRRQIRLARISMRNGRMQDHLPLTEQRDAKGHAVRAGYVYSAMADMARFSDAPDYAAAAEALSKDVMTSKLYVTGGIGTAEFGDEGFGVPYKLPNQSAYCESCAAIANVLWQHRMTLLTAQAKYADVMELTLYNAMLSTMSLAGDAFFYQNPLASKSGGHRSSWIGLSCCPTNIARIFPQIGGLAYAQTKDEVFVNLYLQGTSNIPMTDSDPVVLRTQTDYPLSGKVRIEVTPGSQPAFALNLRIPGWATGKPVPSDLYRFENAATPPVTLTLNGKSTEASPAADGYVHLKRTWKAGDVLELELPMPVRRVLAHKLVEEDAGKVALMRGPLVYCLEGVDNPDLDLFQISLPPKGALTTDFKPNLLGGVNVIRATGTDGKNTPLKLTAIPYYAWCNREKGPMTVWIKE
ncbi:MAG: glycoside hydrolase family 127 protein [Verrucomicrobia bacterium]|nr:glycoside hydrolase family 127 protein [Verrucomicrobiota bacterium]MDA1005069.1 glycoside hydrolase family 127 protein [Verrucomicrobiota bacterium]